MLEAFGLSDPGCVRSNNEDYFITDNELGIFILADGMGGANAGEYASRLSAERLYSFLKDPNNRAGSQTLGAGFVAANTAVREASQSDFQLEGMGTTLLAARSLPNGELEICTVGDSRAYLVSGGVLSQITEDQTWVAEVGSRLGLGEEALRRHPMRHVLTMAIGSTDDLRMGNYVLQLSPGDQLLLCSDGLHGVVSEKELTDTLDSTKNLPEKCHSLVEAAKRAGGPDNVTVVLIQMN
jgi:PPM family protein phosphatase